MLRKLFIWGFLGAIIAAVVYGYLNYAVIALFERDTPKVTYLFVVEKPEMGPDFFYNYFDQKAFDKEIRRLDRENIHIPWHMQYENIVADSVYHITMDNRRESEK